MARTTNRSCAVHVEAFEGVVTIGVVVFPPAVPGDCVVARDVVMRDVVVFPPTVPGGCVVVRGVVVEMGPNVDVVL